MALVLFAAENSHLASRGLLLGLSLVLGPVRAFQMPAQQALVPPLALPRAMAFSSAGTQGAIIGGAALGGLLFVAGAGAQSSRVGSRKGNLAGQFCLS